MEPKECCAICLEKKEQVRTSCCKQPYCLDCFSKAVGTAPRCPTCREYVETEKKDNPGTATAIPKQLLEPSKRKDLTDFLTARLKEHASQIWSFNPLHKWQEVITKAEKCEEYVAEPTAQVLAPYNDTLLDYFDRFKLKYFQALQGQLRQENAIDPVMIRITFRLEDPKKGGIIRMHMKIAVEYRKVYYEVYCDKER